MESPIDTFFEVLLNDPFWLSMFCVLAYYGITITHHINQHKTKIRSWADLGKELKLEFVLQAPSVALSLFLSICILGLDDRIAESFNEEFDSDFVWPWWLYAFGGIWPQIGWSIVGKDGLIPWFINKYIKKVKQVAQ